MRLNGGYLIDRFIILVSDNGDEPWELVKPEDVPEWVKDPDVLGHLATGSMCNDPTRTSRWYRAEVLKEH